MKLLRKSAIYKYSNIFGILLGFLFIYIYIYFFLFFFFQNEEQRVRVLKLILDHEPIAENVDIAKLAKVTEGFSGSDLQELCRNASIYRVRDYLRTHTQLIFLSYHLFTQKLKSNFIINLFITEIQVLPAVLMMKNIMMQYDL